MAGKIIISTERCKGCGLCVVVCPKNSIAISEKSNKKGYFPARANNKNCSGCTMCAVICPEAVIEVYRESTIKIIDIDTNKKGKPTLTKERV